jgi:hypothetical protein
MAELLEADIEKKNKRWSQLWQYDKKMVERLKGEQSLLTNKEKIFRAMLSSKATSANSLKLKVFKILKGNGVEQSSYHGGSLNGKDIKKEKWTTQLTCLMNSPLS